MFGPVFRNQLSPRSPAESRFNN